MKKGELISQIAANLRDAEYRKSVKVPRHTFHISDDDGNTKDFVVQETDKQVMLTVDDVKQVVETCFNLIIESLRRGEPVTVVGFGTFGLKYRAPRRVPSFSNDGYIDIDGHYIPTFRYGERLRAAGRIYEESLKDKLYDASDSQYDETRDPSLNENGDD